MKKIVCRIEIIEKSINKYCLYLINKECCFYVRCFGQVLSDFAVAEVYINNGKYKLYSFSFLANPELDDLLKCYTSIKKYKDEYDDFTNLILNITNLELRAILKELLKDMNIFKKFLYYKASNKNHHSITHGLFLHTYQTMKLSLSISNIFHLSDVEKELVVVGSLLHDLGKVSKEKSVIGHKQASIEILQKYCNRANVSDKIKIMLKNIILHTHSLEFDIPLTPCGYIVKMADNISSSLDEINVNMSEAKTINFYNFKKNVLPAGKILGNIV